ncbi:MAG: tripartite tricarboxylate transporter substrate binding protein [Betaproteobacteria bacterium]|nr:tripartite tricarboxylate transporter substrate binding protein [Betaproteobacteria bacterium]
MMKRLLSAGLLVFVSTGAEAAADIYPSRPIRLVVPHPAGGTPDANARAVAKAIQESLGQTIVIDNRAGAQGIIGAEAVAKASPDGYTLLYTGQAFLVNAGVYRKLPYDIEKDFLPVSQVAVSDGYIIVVHPSLKAGSVRELVELSKSAQRMGYGTPGIGSSQQLAAELLNVMSGARLSHVPYRGLAPAVIALLGGDEVQVVFAPLTVVAQHVATGKLRAIGVTAGARWKSMPDLPTVGETIPGYKFVGGWHGMFAPARTPAAVVSRLHAEIVKAVNARQLRDYLVTGGYEPVASTPAEFRKYVEVDLAQWKKLIQLAKIPQQ